MTQHTSQGAGGTGAGQARIPVNPEFRVHRLNEAGLNKAANIAEEFDRLLNNIRPWLADSPDAGRQNALLRTHLEQACMYAKKSMASDPANQTIVNT